MINLEKDTNMNKKDNKGIAYLGLPGSYSYIAGKKYFGQNCNMVSCSDFKSIFKKVSEDICNEGIVPIENSLTGSLVENYDLLQKTSLKIVGEIFLKINHYLLGKTTDKIKLKEIKNCYLHPEVFSQCRTFFDTHPWIKAEFTLDNGSAAKKVSEIDNKQSVAIGSKMAADINKLKMLTANLVADCHNYTRFAVISKKPNRGGNKISLIFSVEHKPGSLNKVLTVFAKYRLNLTKIESRPAKVKPWEYIFFLDFEYGKNKKEVEIALQKVKQHVIYIKVSGRYKKGKVYAA